MDAIEINYRLKRLGLTQSKLAAELQVSAGLISNVIHDRASCFHVAQHIAELLHEDIHTLWPRRYVFKPRGEARRAVTSIGTTGQP